MNSGLFGSSPGGRRNQRRHREGRGLGRGADYKPQLKTHDVPSIGRSTRMPLDGRMAHLLSDLETRLVIEFQWSPQMSDIREQVPLDLERTLAIADEMGIKHPTIPGDGAPVVMTTDIVAVHSGASEAIICARSVKMSHDIEPAESGRARRQRQLAATLEKLEIERRYWQDQGADWRFVCEHDLDRVRAANIRLLLSWEGLDASRGPTFWQDALDLSARTILKGQDNLLRDIGGRLEDEGRLSRAQFMDCARHLCATRQLTFDMSQHFGPELRACDLEPANC